MEKNITFATLNREEKRKIKGGDEVWCGIACQCSGYWFWSTSKTTTSSSNKKLNDSTASVK